MGKYRLFLISLLIMWVLFACRPPGSVITEPTLVEIERIHPAGSEVAQMVFQTLKGELQKAMQMGGSAGALDVCHMKAIPLTDQVREKFPEVMEIKRTTFLYRNPANAPGHADSLALNYYMSVERSGGEFPEHYVQKEHSDEGTLFHYYRPVLTDGICLVCHGDPAKMDTSVIRIIRRLYPGDQATGYQAGDFRGLIRVTIRE
ncbi:MAG: DUF3365 domain-containing protein [Bacteroidales bacterium]|nr:DUF3365 domain-containing protein [Bacteroidales bacterium]